MKKRSSIRLWSISILAMGLPAAVMWYRTLPLRAESADGLWIQVFSQERGHIESELGQRSSKLLVESESTARWGVIRQSMLDQGATQKEADRILRQSEGSCLTDDNARPIPHWPIFVRRGYVRGRSVWVSVCASQAQNPTAAEIVTGWDYFVRVIDPKNPREINGVYSSNQSFPRCEGPNTPFPVGR